MSSPNPELCEFEITILRGYKASQNQQQQPSSWPLVAKFKGKDGLINQKEGTLELSDENRQELIALGNDAEAYGTVLGQALFQGKVGTAFSDAFSGSEFQLRFFLSIEVDDQDDLRRLQWERLCFPEDSDQEDWYLLALDRRVIYSLYISGWVQNSFHIFEQADLRALVLVASPNYDEKWKLDTFDAEAAIQSVRTALGDIPCAFLTNIDVPERMGPPTLDALSQELTQTDKPYNLLHFVCHGKATPGGNVLFGATDKNEVLLIKEKDLIRRLKGLPGDKGLPHFAFLCACETAMPEAGDALGGLAQTLVRKLGMPAVVGMTRKVTVKTALAFGQNFYQQLKQSGYVDEAFQEAMAGLESREDIIVPVLFSRLRGRPLFLKPQAGESLNAQKIKDGLKKLERLLKQRAPKAKVLRQNFEAQSKILRKHLKKPHVPEDALPEKALTELNALCLQVLDLTFHELALGEQLPEYEDIECPFPGLSAFGKKDQGERQYQSFFFGRDELVEELQHKLEGDNNVMTVYGPSGSGKSSLVMAGLVPKLEQKGYVIDELTPGHADALEQLEAAIAEVSKAEQALLVIDQFEELFTLCTEPDRNRFIDRFLEFAYPSNAEEAQTRKVVITVRGDFLAECAYHRELKDQVNLNSVLVGPMQPDELGRAIQQQADAVGLHFEAGLSNAILAEVEQEPGIMPLLQYALELLYERRRGNWLCREEYEAIGGVKKAIATIADDIYQKLSEEGEGDHIREIFEQLTHVDESDAEDKPRDTRQRVKQDDIQLQDVDAAETRQKRVSELVNRLATDRLVVIKDGTVEVSHEALIREWTPLQTWLNENRAELTLIQQIKREAEEWQKQLDKPNQEDYLRLQGVMLQQASGLKTRQKLTETAQRYVEACEALEQSKAEAAEQQIKRLKRLLAESQLQEGAMRLEKAWNETVLREKLTQVISALGENREALPDKLLSSVQFNICRAYREVYQAKVIYWHDDVIRAIAFSPVRIETPQGLGYVIVSGSDDGTVRLWDLAGNTVGEPFNHGDRVNAVAFSPDGQTIASGGPDGAVRLWDLAGNIITELFNHDDLVRSVVFSPDGTKIVSGSFDKTVRLSDLAGNVVGKPFEHEDWVTCVAFSPDGQSIVSACNDKTVRLWDLAGNAIGKPCQHEDRVTSVAFSPDGTKIVSGGYDKKVRLWDLAGNAISEPFQHDDLVRSVAFSLDGTRIVSGSFDQTVRLWDLAGNAIGEPFKHEDRVTSVAFAPDGTSIVSGSYDSTVRLWGLESGVQKGFKHEDLVCSVAFSPDGTKIVSSSYDSTIRFWDLKGNAIGESFSHKKLVSCVAFSPDGMKIVSGSFDHTVRLWDLKGNAIGEPFQHEDRVTSVAFSPDGMKIVSSSFDHTVRLWDLEGNNISKPFKHKDLVRSVAFSPDGTKIVSGSFDHTVRLWDLDGNALCKPFHHEDWVVSVAFSPDGMRIASGGDDGTVRLWDLEGHLITEPFKHESGVTAVAFSPGGMNIVSGSNDGTVRLWDLTGNVIGEPFIYGAPIASVAVSPDGTMVVIGSEDNTLCIWNKIDWRSQLQVCCDRLNNHWDADKTGMARRACWIEQAHQLAEAGDAEAAIQQFKDALQIPMDEDEPSLDAQELEAEAHRRVDAILQSQQVQSGFNKQDVEKSED